MPSYRDLRLKSVLISSWLLFVVTAPVLAEDDRAETQPTARRSATSDGPGMLARGGFLAGSTLGRDDSIIPLQAMPYMLFDPHFVFTDVRLFVSTQGRVGGNLGGGYRFLDERHGAWYGVNGWIDVDQTSGQVFPQLGLGVEAAWSIFEGRSNFYLPVGTRDQVLETSALNTRYSGHNILFDQHTITGRSLVGVDGEIGVSLPIEALDRALILRGFVGGYHFANDHGAAINGIRARSEVVMNSSLITQLEYTSDDEYGQNLIVGASIEWPWGEDHPGVEWRRPTPSPFRMVQRNFNVILDRNENTANNQVAINPATSQAYFVQHVDSQAASSGDGTIESPFRTFAPATAQAADIILVHAGSDLHESIIVPDNTRVLGDTGRQSFQAVGWGNISLPALALGETPMISDIQGDAVTLGTGSEFSGFQFDNITGTAVRAINSTDLLLSDLTFTEIYGDAIWLSDIADGNVTLTNLSLEQISGRGIVASNLDGQLIASNLTLNNISDPTIQIDGGSGDAYFTGDTIVTGDHSQIDIRNTSGHVEFAGLDVTGDSASPLVTLTNLSGDFSVASLELENSNGAGLMADNVASLAITKGNIRTVDGTALSLADSDVAVTLTSVNADGGDVGVRLENITGGLLINGGTIENTGIAISLDDVESVQLSSLELVDNTVGIQSRSADYLKIDRLTFTGTAGYALDSLDDALLSVQNSTFSGNGALDAGTIRVQATTSDLFRSEFLSNSITDDRGTAWQFLTTTSGAGASLSTTLSGNTIIGSRGGQSGVRMNWNGPAEIFFSGNTFQLSGSSMTAIDLTALSNSEALSSNITGNTFTLGGAHSVGIHVAAASTSQISVTGNTITHDGLGGIGLQFDFSDATELWVSTNYIEDTAGGATGMKFQHVATLSELQIENNQIDLTSSSSSVDRGILFQSIDDDVELT